MVSKLRAGAVVALSLLVGSVTVAFATSPGSGPSRSGERETVVLHLKAKEVAETYVDVLPTDFSQGDQFVFVNDLFQGDKRVGQDGGTCILTRLTSEGASTVYCTGSNSLPGGQVTVSGLIDYGADEEFKKDPYSLAITGGTGRYRTARGEVTIKELSTKEFRLTLRIVL